VTVDARRLRGIVRLEERRRRAAHGLVGRIEGPLARGVLGGALGAALLAGIAARADLATARGWWVVGALLAALAVVGGAPFRMFWRRDATLLARLPIAGRELYRVATWLSLRAAGGWLLALLLAGAPLAAGLGAGSSLRLAFLAAGLLVAGALAAPVAGTVAGAVVVSAKAQALIRDVSSGQAASGVVWLSLIPGFSALGLAWAGWTAASRPELLRDVIAGSLAVCSVLHVIVQRLAAFSLAASTREVAALDAVKLAHVERVDARGLERLWGRAAAGAARAVYLKDVALLRRRHPGFYLLTGLGVLALWIVAWRVEDPARSQIVLGGAGALAAYVVLLAHRLGVPPTEQPRLLATLPLAPGAAVRAKTAYLAWRALWAVGVGGAPAVARSDRPLLLGLALAAVALLAVAVGAALLRRRAENLG
jgi:hypothetical protein